MGLFLIWKAFCSYQVKEKRKQNEVNVQKCHFTQANEIAALEFVTLTNYVLALGLHFVQIQICCCQSFVKSF